MKKMKGSFSKNKIGRLEYNLDGVTAKFLVVIRKILLKEYRFHKVSDPINGLNEVVVVCSKNDIELNLEWDIWMGLYLISNSVEADSLVAELGSKIDKMINDSEFQLYHTDHKKS